MPTGREYRIGTIVHSIYIVGIVLYEIRPDSINGFQSENVFGVFPARRYPMPAGVRVAYRNELPGDEHVFDDTKFITGVWEDSFL